MVPSAAPAAPAAAFAALKIRGVRPVGADPAPGRTLFGVRIDDAVPLTSPAGA